MELTSKGHQVNKQFWDDMRSNGFLVADAPARKVAIYPNGDGAVVIAVRDISADIVTEIQVSEVDAAVSALVAAKKAALPVLAEFDAQHATHVAIEKARS